MASKKPAPKKKAPAHARAKAKPAPRRAPVSRPAPAALPAPVAAAAASGASPTAKILVAAVILIALGIVAVIAKQRHQAADSAAAAVPPAASPAPTAVPPAELPPIQAEGPKMSGDQAPAHREAASAEVKPKPTPKPKPTAQPQAAEPAAAPKAAASAPASAGARDDDSRRVSAEHPLKVRAWRKEGATATVDIFGAHNKVLAHLESDAGAAGWQTLAWDGLDPQGQAAPAGLVYVRASATGLQDILRVRIR